MHRVRAADVSRTGLRQPDVQDLALGDQVGQRADGVSIGVFGSTRCW